MDELSPGAQAVLDAVVDDVWGLRPIDVPRLSSEARQFAAAAIRAAVAVVLPDDDLEPHDPVVGEYTMARRDERRRQQHNFLSIANELDPQP